MHPHIHKLKQALIHLLSCSILLLPSCEDPATETEQSVKAIQDRDQAIKLFTDAEIDSLQTQIAIARGPEAMSYNADFCMAVCRSEYDAFTTAFNDGFRVKRDGRYVEMAQSVVSFPWQQLKTAINTKTSVAYYDKGVKACYGLDPVRKEFVLGLEIVLLKHAGGTTWVEADAAIDKDPDFYIVDGHDLDKITRADWQQYAQLYKDSIFTVDSLTDPMPKALRNCDHLEYLLSWDLELVHLGEHNLPTTGLDVEFSNAARVVRYDAAETNPMCDPLVRLRQFTIVSLESRLTNFPHPTKPKELWAYQKGIDLGTPCPPRCKKWILQSEEADCADPNRCLTER